MKLGVLCSGNLGFQMLVHLSKKQELSFVFTDAHSSPIVSFCQNKRIPLFIGNPRNGKCLTFIKNHTCDVLLSINYLFIIDRPLIDLPSLYAINFHGSLLPKYRGRTPHVWAIINNEKKTGVTAHLIDDNCDTGDIVEQIEIPIKRNDTGAKILEKFNILYALLLDKVLAKISSNQVELKVQDHQKATFFGKRTPEDGQIDWSWQKERIFNWVRAQAFPYPGAFSFINEQKVTIDEVQFSDLGFDCTTENGTILSINPICVKTANGAIELVAIREQSLNLKVGQKFK